MVQWFNGSTLLQLVVSYFLSQCCVKLELVAPLSALLQFV